MRVSKSLFFAAFLLLIAVPTRLMAGGAASLASEPLESVVILQVDGWIGINPEGGVAEFTSDTKMLPKLRDSLNQVVSKWRFEPIVIDGTPRNVRAKTRVVLAASQVGGVYQVKVDNVTFPNDVDATPGTDEESPWPMTGHKLGAPKWPPAMAETRLSAMVLLTILVGADGHPEEVLAVQSMLFDVKGKERVLRNAIDHFEKSAVVAAKRWRFNIPAGRRLLPADKRTVNVPVEFAMKSRAGWELPGKWRTIVRGPKRKVYWVPESSEERGVGVSDVAAGEVMSAAHAVKLKTEAVGTVLL